MADTPDDATTGPGGDEDEDLDALEALGFTALVDAGPPGGGLDDVERRVRRRSVRRRWLAGAAAAVVVLVAAAVGVTMARTGQDSLPVTTGGGTGRYLLPPADATNVSFQIGADGVMPGSQAIDDGSFSSYRIVYDQPGGGRFQLVMVQGASTSTGSTLVGSGDSAIGGVMAPTDSSRVVIQAEGIGDVAIVCPGSGPTGGVATPTVTAPTEVPGLPVAGGPADGQWAFSLKPVLTAAAGTRVPVPVCALDQTTVDTMTLAVRSLRVVTDAELRQYLKDHAATNGLAQPPWVASANATTAALAADESSARADAQRLISEIPGGTCVKPYQVDLGALRQLGQWEDICRFGAPGSSSGGLQLHATSDGPSLVFGPGPAGLDVCYRQVGDAWWITHGPGQDPAAPCPGGYTFQGA